MQDRNFSAFLKSKWTIGILISVGLMVAILFAAKILLRNFIKQQLDTELNKISTKMQQPITFQDFDFGLGSISLTDLAVGEGPFFSVSKIQFQLDLFPWGKNFKKLTNVQGSYFYVKLSAEEIAALNVGLNSRLSQKLHNRYPAQSQRFTAINRFKNEVLNRYFTSDARFFLGNGKVIWQRKVNEPIAIEAVDFDLKLNRDSDPTLELTYKSKQSNSNNHPFKISIKSQNEALSIKFSGSQIPEPFINNVPWIMPWLRGVPSVDGHLILTNIDSSSYQFKTEIKIAGLSLDNPRLSFEPVGPLNFDVDSDGVIDFNDQQLQVEKFNILFHNPSGNPVTLQMSSLLNIRKTIGDNKNFASNLTLALTMPSTDCSSVIQTFSESVLGDVKKFKLEGKVDFGMSFQFNLHNPEDTNYRFDQFNFDCTIIEAPMNFSQKYLESAFVLERASDGERIKEIHVDPRDANFASFNSIAKVLVDTVVASEDTGFWAHHGIEAGALEQAVKRNLSEGRLAVGGSTITMQTARNLFLSRDKNLTRKLQEIFLSWYLEKILTKKRIMEIYLNIIEYGPNIFGIQNASQHYFDKPAAMLTLKQSVFLAQLLPAPVARYRNFCLAKPTDNFNFLMENLLSRMLKLGRISSESYVTAVGSPLKLSFGNRLSSFCSTP